MHAGAGQGRAGESRRGFDNIEGEWYTVSSIGTFCMYSW